MSMLDIRREDITTSEALMERTRTVGDADDVIDVLATREQMVAIYHSLRPGVPGKDFRVPSAHGWAWRKVTLRCES